MNILQISSASSIGGGERHLLDLVDGLVRGGHTVTVALRPMSPVRERLTALPAERIVGVPLRNSLDFLSARVLRKLVREREIDVVHAHLARDYPLAAFAARGLPKTQLILTRHVLFPLSRFQRLIFGRAGAVIAVSAAVKQELLKQRIVAEGKIRVIHNGIDLARFADPNLANSRRLIRQQLGLRKYAKLVGSVGSLVSLKGHEDLIGAAAIVTQTDPDTHFVIIGDEPPGERATVGGLREVIDRAGMAHRVHLMRGVEDVAPWLHALDLFVSASHSESFGLAIVEAMAAGCAVLATATPGAAEVLEDGVTGRLTAVGDVSALAASITAMLADPEFRAGAGRHATFAARLLFSADRMVADTAQVYHDAVHANR